MKICHLHKYRLIAVYEIKSRLRELFGFYEYKYVFRCDHCWKEYTRNEKHFY